MTRTIIALAFFFFLVGMPTANALTIVPYGHNVSGVETWDKAGSPYVVRSMGIGAGGTLNILPGTIVKFDQGAGIGVGGTLTVGEAGEESVIFTSYKDDNGGDTNGDGTATLPTPGDWTGVIAYTGGTIHLINSQLLFGGGYSGGTVYGALQNNGGMLTVEQSVATSTYLVALVQHSGTTTLNQVALVASQYVVYMLGGSLTATESTFDGGTGGGTINIYHADGALTVHQSTINIVRSYGVYSPTSNIPDLTENYWGDPSGPTVFDNPGGVGASLVGSGLYRPFLGADPNLISTICYIDCNSNVLFLPGLEASRLYRPDYNGGTARLWEPEILHDNTEIFLDASGIPNRSDIYTKDIIDNAYLSIKGNIYRSFIDSMDNMKSTGVIHDWKAIPYDWRLSPDDLLNNGNDINGHIYYSGNNAPTSTPYIIQELRRLAASSRTGKVTIIAHSNGGLVAKVLTDKLGVESSALIDLIIFVAVPQVGTPKAIGAILHGYDQGLPTDWAPFFINPEEARTLAKNMPSASYFTYTEDPVVTFDNSALLAPWRARYGDDAIHSGERLHTFLVDQSRIALPIADDLLFPISGNETLLNSAEILHNTKLDNWTPPTGVQLTEIAGWGEKAMKSIEYYEGRKTTCTTPGDIHTCTDAPALKYGVKEVMDGDGTVVVPSALWTPASTGVRKYWVDLLSYGESGFGTTFNRKHADILEVPELRILIQNLIKKSDPIDDTNKDIISTVSPTNDNPKTRLRFTLHSPLSLDLYDNLGNHTGISTTTGFLEENIPGSRYATYGELKLIEAPASTTLYLVMNGYAVGSFTLDVVQEIGDIIIASTTFAGIPTTADTVATMNFTDGTIANASALSTDLDGNGTAELSLLPVVGDIVTLPVLKSPLTVTPDNKTITLGSSIPALTATLTGFESGDTATSSTLGTTSCTTTATPVSPVGTYLITCTKGTLISSKYDFTIFATGTLTITYKWSGFSQPINDTAYNPTQSLSVFKGGSTVPVKFQIKNASGVTVQSSTTPIWLTPQRGSAMSVAIDESTYFDSGTTGTTYKWDAMSQQYIYNWSTKGLAIGYWYRIYAKLEDGTIQSVMVGLR